MSLQHGLSHFSHNFKRQEHHLCGAAYERVPHFGSRVLLVLGQPACDLLEQPGETLEGLPRRGRPAHLREGGPKVKALGGCTIEI